MKKYIHLVVLMLFVSTVLVAQEEIEAPEKTVDKPVRAPWESGVLINHHTSVIQPAKTLEMVINHRFGPVNNGMSDIYGIMAPGANIRIGFNYSILDNVMVGFGTNSQKQYQDLQVKYTPFQQTRENTIPVSLTVYGNMAINAQDENVFGQDYTFTDRLTYFGEVIVGRKVTDALSVMASANFTHFNSVDSIMDHDKIGVGVGARFKVSPQSSLTIEWGLPLEISSISEQKEFINHPKHHLSIGWEVSTSTHAFQIFVTNSLSILPQEMYMNNQNEFDKDGIRFGFNITRLWNF